MYITMRLVATLILIAALATPLLGQQAGPVPGGRGGTRGPRTCTYFIEPGKDASPTAAAMHPAPPIPCAGKRCARVIKQVRGGRRLAFIPYDSHNQVRSARGSNPAAVSACSRFRDQDGALHSRRQVRGCRCRLVVSSHTTSDGAGPRGNRQPPAGPSPSEQVMRDAQDRRCLPVAGARALEAGAATGELQRHAVQSTAREQVLGVTAGPRTVVA